MPHQRRCSLGSGVALAALALLGGCRREASGDSARLLAARGQGLSSLQTGEIAEAERWFQEVIALAPDEALGHANLALAYLAGGRLGEAETAARRAFALDSVGSEVSLALSSVLAARGRAAEARGILERQARHDDDPVVLFALAQLDTAARGGDERLALLWRLVERVPTNIAVRMELLDALAARGDAADARRILEEIRRLPPEPPPEVLAPYRTALADLRAGRIDRARSALAGFRDAVVLTPAYQASLAEVKGPEGPMVGRPVLTFSPRFALAQRATALGAAITDAVMFQDGTEGLGLAATSGGAAPAGLAIGDFDGDGHDDLFTSRWDAAAATWVPALHRVRLTGTDDVTRAARVSFPVAAAFATFADYDNDGHPDLLAIGIDGRTRLLRNTGRARFEDRTTRAGIDALVASQGVRFVDMDHDGDLDLLAFGARGLHAMRNNADGTFSDATDASGLRVSEGVLDLAFADVDGDGRIDLLLGQGIEGLRLLRNIGRRQFEDATAASGLAGAGEVSRLAVGDVDNDGAFEVVTAPMGSGAPTLWRGSAEGRFRRDRRDAAWRASLATLRSSTLRFADYDNDGWLDLFLAGTRPDGSAGGFALLRNDGTGVLTDRSALLPSREGEGVALETFDLDRDGDEDLALVGAHTGPRLIRNVGGNANLFLQVRLTALRTGSGKNNTFGVGAKVEVRVGDVVQTRTATGSPLTFGLGAHLKADVLRVIWPNGVPQVIHFPGSDQDVLENEVLKSSCGFLYAWDGERFAFVTDVMWRSALGMPLGIMGSGTAWAPAAASQEYLRVSGDLLRPSDGRYLLQLTEELWETSYTDEVRLLAVDHPDSVAIHVDERFVPPGPVSLRVFRATRIRAPRAAVDDRGNDLASLLRDNDDRFVANLVPLQYQGLVEPHDLILDLGPEAGAAGTQLYLRGWIYPTDASINVALSQQTALAPTMPILEVRDGAGAWRKAADVGFPSGKDKTVVVDLAGIFPTTDRRVRIRTNLQIHWDQAFVAVDATEAPMRISPVPLLTADLHFRGTSRTFRKGGTDGPHWFDYADVTVDPIWLPIPGAYTRYGDVRRLLDAADDRYIVMAPGDETTLAFDATAVPALPAGWRRDFLLYTDGWIKDADMNTAFGDSVEPLPFHGIRAYPYAPGEGYPTSAELTRFLREYNTRVVRRR